jgi:hypothetical protein
MALLKAPVALSKSQEQTHSPAIGIVNEGKILVDDLKVFDPV